MAAAMSSFVEYPPRLIPEDIRPATWVGPIKLRGYLESALGLGGLYSSAAERVAFLAGTVRSVEGFW